MVVPTTGQTCAEAIVAGVDAVVVFDDAFVSDVDVVLVVKKRRRTAETYTPHSLVDRDC